MTTEGSVLDLPTSVGSGEPVDLRGGAASDRVKISMNILRSDLENLRVWAKQEDTSMTDIIRRALVVLRFLVAENRAGRRIVLQKDGERDRELVLQAIR